MPRWEYREVIWQREQILVTDPDPDDDAKVASYSSSDWYALLARFGRDGWEMISCTGAPTGIHEYYLYFKRPAED